MENIIFFIISLFPLSFLSISLKPNIMLWLHRVVHNMFFYPFFFIYVNSWQEIKFSRDVKFTGMSSTSFVSKWII
jgi:hypothetical protein